MQRYWYSAYVMQLTAVVSMFVAMLLKWHTEHGTGLSLMNKALTTTIKFGLDPFNPDEIPVSHWWIVWIIPLIGVALGMRSIVGVMFKRLKGQAILAGLLGFFAIVSSAWYIFNFHRDLLIGFWMEMVALGILLVAVVIEFLLPDHTPYEQYILHLPPDHPERIASGYTKVCDICGTHNDLDAKICRDCHSRLFIE